MIYVLILLTTGSHASSSAGYEFYSLENCQTALAAAEELDTFGHGVYGICVKK
jgi:hypothetical protein